MTSKTRHDVNKCVMTSKTRHDVKGAPKHVMTLTKIPHDAQNTL